MVVVSSSGRLLNTIDDIHRPDPLQVLASSFKLKIEPSYFIALLCQVLQSSFRRTHPLALGTWDLPWHFWGHTL